MRFRRCKLWIHFPEYWGTEARIVKNFAEMVLQLLNTGKTVPIHPFTTVLNSLYLIMDYLSVTDKIGQNIRINWTLSTVHWSYHTVI